ncbi:MAG: DNA repair protein RecN [Gammaproteobacteria bacterium]|nr:DNA repair protein RecN [Gammaproteobacteria bacterium]MYD79302.1 DNA repair protein RecN [Gammaproteobacteria bacterium]
MLVNLSVRNFALVRELDLSFDPGLTVITGESGAGKSILLEALSLVLGSRARREQTRPGEQQCEVTAEFKVDTSPRALTFLEEHDLVDSSDASRCLVRRIARVDGRSRAWINGTQVNVDTLRTLCTPLVALHGQFEQTQLVDPLVQLDWFDDFSIDSSLRVSVSQKYTSWRRAMQDFETANAKTGGQFNQMDLLRYQVEELDALDLQEGEFERLRQLHKRITSSQEIRQLLHESLELLRSGIHSDFSAISRTLSRIDDENDSLSQAKKLLESTKIQIEECELYLNQYADHVESNEEDFESVEARLNLIYDIARKHKVTPNQLYEQANSVRNSLATLSAAEKQIEALRQSSENRHAEFLTASKKLSIQRQECSPKFCREVVQVLAHLALENVKFETAFENAENSRGIDSLEYLVSTNSKYDPMPLGRIASGGELSRIALAILVVVANRSNLPCLVLDEADVGIGGVTADMVGRMLRTLARNNQVLCVTHAPQVAALGGSHMYVHKTEGQEIQVAALDQDDRVDEIARMVASRAVDEESRKYARTLIANAQS